MKMHRDAAKTGAQRRMFGGLAAALLLTVATPSYALVSVIESGVRASTQAVATAAEGINASMTVAAQAAVETQQAIGTQGNTPGAVGGALGDAVGSGAEFYQNMQDFGFDMCAVTLCRGGDPVGTKNIDDARRWAMRNFYTQGDGNGQALLPEAQRDLREIRRRGIVYSTTNALATSVTIHNDLAGADGTANALESKIAEAPTLRADIQANSAILLAQYKVQLQQLAVLTTQLDVMATNAIAGTDIYHEEGGTQFADAFIDTDFQSDFSTRKTVTVPTRGSGALSLAP